MLAILGELCWLEFFKTVYLETSNVQFGSFFQNPVTYIDATELFQNWISEAFQSWHYYKTRYVQVCDWDPIRDRFVTTPIN